MLSDKKTFKGPSLQRMPLISESRAITSIKSLGSKKNCNRCFSGCTLANRSRSATTVIRDFHRFFVRMASVSQPSIFWDDYADLRTWESWVSPLSRLMLENLVRFNCFGSSHLLQNDLVFHALKFGWPIHGHVWGR